MDTRKHLLTKVFVVVMCAVVFVMYLITRTYHFKGQAEVTVVGKPKAVSRTGWKSLHGMSVRRRWTAPRHDENPMSDAEKRFFGALLGRSDLPLDLQTRRVLSQAFLCLKNAQEVVDTIGQNRSPNSSLVTLLRAHGAALFWSDYAYACRICPDLDPGATNTVYTNALAVVGVKEFVDTASNVVESTYQTGGQKRPPAPLQDHYAIPFSPDARAEDAVAYRNLLEVLWAMAGYDPLSTDLFNDAVVYAMSVGYWRKNAEETARMHAKIARWERLGLAPSLEGDGDDPGSIDQAEIEAELAADTGTLLLLKGLRDIYGYRFAEYHGLPKEEALSRLEKQPVPLATWTHISANLE